MTTDNPKGTPVDTAAATLDSVAGAPEIDFAGSFEVTPALLADTLTFGDDAASIPPEMIGTLQRVWRDSDFVWPVTVSVVGIAVSAGPRPGERASQDASSHEDQGREDQGRGDEGREDQGQEDQGHDLPRQDVWATVSVVGTGWAPDRPVSLRFENAFGFENDTVALLETIPDASGLFGIEIVITSVPRTRSAWEWTAARQLILRAAQPSGDDSAGRDAEQGGIPPHAVWQWVR